MARFTDYALDQMAVRGIDRDDVENVLADPEDEEFSREPPYRYLYVRPIIPLRRTPDVLRGASAPPTCEHGEWTFAGSDSKRGASKWRCPTGECKPA